MSDDIQHIEVSHLVLPCWELDQERRKCPWALAFYRLRPWCPLVTEINQSNIRPKDQRLVPSLI